MSVLPADVVNPLVVAVFDPWLRAHGFGFDNYVGEWLSYAFTHARLHIPHDAREWLEKCLASWPLSDAVRRKLRQRLEEMLAG